MKTIYELDTEFNIALGQLKFKHTEKVVERGRALLRKRGQHTPYQIKTLSISDPSFSVNFTEVELVSLIAFMRELNVD